MYKRDDIANDLKVVYIRTKGPFREIETFVEEIKEHYGVTLLVTEGELKSTLQRLLDQDDRLKAGLMGTRRTDPYSEKMQFMQVIYETTNFNITRVRLFPYPISPPFEFSAKK